MFQSAPLLMLSLMKMMLSPAVASVSEQQPEWAALGVAVAAGVAVGLGDAVGVVLLITVKSVSAVPVADTIPIVCVPGVNVLRNYGVRLMIVLPSFTV